MKTLMVYGQPKKMRLPRTSRSLWIILVHIFEKFILKQDVPIVVKFRLFHVKIDQGRAF